MRLDTAKMLKENALVVCWGWGRLWRIVSVGYARHRGFGVTKQSRRFIVYAWTSGVPRGNIGYHDAVAAPLGAMNDPNQLPRAT